MVFPVFGFRHLRPLTSPSTSTCTKPVSVVSACALVPALARVVAGEAILSGGGRTRQKRCYHALVRHHHHHRNNLRHDSILFPFLPPQSPCHHSQTRGKKTTTTVRLSDLPQGLIQPTSTIPSPASSQSSSADPPTALQNDTDPLLRLPQDPPAYPTVVLQASRNMRKFDNCVLLTRVGGFYELYLEHATEYGPLLNIKVASKRTNAGPVPMVSFHPIPTRECH